MAHSAVKDFLRLLAKRDRSKRQTEVFADFCELAYCALAKKASPYPDQRDQLEAQYMQVVARYRDPDDVRAMPEMLALALTTISAGGIDFIGEVAGEIGALDAGLGQFFTPYEVSRLMAEMALNNVDELLGEKGFITLQEPAAGAGGMLLAAADVLEGRGIDIASQVWIEAVELSRSTYHMLYVQASARGLAGRVICGNSLSLETYSSAYTAAAPVFIAKNGHPFATQIQQVRAAESIQAQRANLLAELTRQHMAAAE